MFLLLFCEQEILGVSACLPVLAYNPRPGLRRAMPGISSMSGGLHPGDVSTSGVFVSSLCDGGRWRVWDDLHWVTSMPLKFPAFQACACGPLVPDRQPSPRQEVSKHKDPHSRPAQGSGCQLWPSGVMGQGRDECEALCKDRKNLSLQRCPRPASQGRGYRG